MVAPARGFGAFRTALRLLFGRIVGIYFRDIEVAGDVPSADTGGRLFGANHVNALVDPILVLTQAPCPISPVAKSTLWKIPGLRWLLDAADAVPIVRRKDDPTKSEKDNDAVFERVAAHLSGGGNILIFPEGTSHNEPHLLSLRSGAGRMLARAREGATASEGASWLTFQAVALEFDARDVFRSRTLVLFGPVRHVDDLARDVAASEGDALARAVTTTLHDDLAELLIEGASWDERLALVQVAEMFANEGADDRTLEGQSRLGRRIEEARRVLGGAEVASLEARAIAYRSELEDAAATDALVRRFARRGGEAEPEVSRDRIARAAAMILTLPLAVFGMVLYWLPYQLPRAVTRRLHGDPDVASTYKLGVGLLVFPLWAAAAIAIAWSTLPPPAATALTAAVLASPFAALPWVDRWDRLAARLRLLAPSEQRGERLVHLAETRAALLADLEKARDRADGATPASAGEVRA
jgi:glycerol-3-phosphate O-acyltransferase/dihydroxyacetone phosphate acyltransferase